MSAFSWGGAGQPSARGVVGHPTAGGGSSAGSGEGYPSPGGGWVIHQLEVGYVSHQLEVCGSAISWKRAGQLSAGDVSPPARPRLFTATHFVTPGDLAMLNTGIFLS